MAMDKPTSRRTARTARDTRNTRGRATGAARAESDAPRDGEWVEWDKAPTVVKSKSGNPYMDDVRRLWESMPKDDDGVPVDRSGGMIRRRIPGDPKSVRKHLRWLWDAGDKQPEPVSVRQERIPVDGSTDVDLYFWTSPKIRKSTLDDE